MLAHSPVRARLRDALEHSPVGMFLRGARARWAATGAHGRLPSQQEIRGLERRGNACEHWTDLRLLGAGSLEGIRGCRFEGHVILDARNGAPLLRDSVIRDSCVGAANRPMPYSHGE
jgi:hypothetical protein